MSTLREAILRYKDVLMVTHAASSVKTYLSRLRFLQTELGGEQLITEISLPMLEKALAAYRKNRSANTTCLAVTAWREFLSWCVDVELIVINPSTRLRSPRRTKWQPRPMSEEAMHELLRRIRAELDSSDWRQIRNESIVRLLLFTGLRRAELASLSWEMIDLFGEVMTVTGKGSKQRIVPLTPTALNILRRLQSAQGRSYGAVIAKEDGTALHPYTINMIFRRWVQVGLGIEVSPHVLRHTFATMLAEREIELDVIRDLLGHESIATTQVYVKTSMERMRKAVETLERTVRKR